MTDVEELEQLDLAELLRRVELYEQEESLPVPEFERYARTETALENVLQVEAARRASDFDYDGCIELLDQVIGLNQRLADIAERELRQLEAAGQYGEAADTLRNWRDLAQGLILIVQGLIHSQRSDERRLTGDIEGAEQALAEAMRYFDQLARSDLPQQQVGMLRGMLAHATNEFLSGLREMRAANFRGAYHFLDRCRVMFEELLESAREEHRRDDGSSAAQFQELERDLSVTLAYARAVQSQVEMLREVQVGNHGAAVECGQESIRVFESLVEAAVAESMTRNVVALRRMELAYVRGWLSWSQAEYAVDERDWAQCRVHARHARTHWNEAARLVTRNNLLGLVSGQNDQGNTELLLQSTLRRCEREQRFHREIEELRGALNRINPIVIHNQGGQGGSAMTNRDNFTFNAPVTNTGGAIGNQEHVEIGQVHHQQVLGPTDFRALAEELAELREAMAAGARTDQEREVVARVREAEEAARRADEQTVRSRLAAAGRWALTMAQNLMLTAATAAIQRSIGA
ncbi:hypothetical protein [Phytohabitans houttuyneae]|uniref:Uncharacterized protein n=1 Tax=Phytohabitans houttuyneae TaxID=1076126 RepID=A0A6V8KTP6_9ACTN|nr:hypothetical protein [Phytohabitans houttuyneae]GFJ85691.1 hypothetical protein Phou_098710 [Phytohabitans houttuyneae]